MISTVRSFAKRETIFSAGDAAGRLPKLVTGAVILYTLLDDGRRQVVNLAGPGDFLHFEVSGELDHFAEALVPSQIVWFDAEDLLARPDAAQVIIDQMRDRLGSERRHITMLSRKSAVERLSEFIRLAADCMGRDGDQFELPLTRQQIADFTGLTLETVSRTFAQWQRECVLIKVAGRRYRMSEALAA